jgi:glycosyltransferase involved in cell wall biosynthesis
MNGIAIEAFLLRSGHTGVERSILNLILTICENATDKVTIFIVPGCEFLFPSSNTNVLIRCVPVRSNLGRVFFQHFLFRFWLRGFSRVFFTGYLGSFFFPAKLSAIAVYDLIALEQSNLVKFRTRYYYRLMLPWFLRRAAIIIVPSEKVKAGVQRYAPCGRVVKLSLPVDEKFYGTNKYENRVQKFEHDQVLIVGFGEIKKNHHLLEEIAPRFPDRIFYLVGRRQKVEHFPSNVIVLGFLPQEELVELYRCSKVLLFLSFQEGYGLPIFEALVSNTNALTWSVPPFTETRSSLLHHPESNSLNSLIKKLDFLLECRKEQPLTRFTILRWKEYWDLLEQELRF